MTGPDKPDATIDFASGLNVVSGPSDTGKSYIVETLDFMLGGATPPRQIPESLGYDKARLAIEALDGKRFEFSRSLQGGDFLLSDLLEPSAGLTELGARHSATSDDNISAFLLRLVDLDGRRLRKNANNELQSLSFRHIAPMVVVDEESIIKKGSPVFTGESTARTVQASLFKLFMTGTDDGSLVATKKRAIARAEIEAQIALLDQLVQDYQTDLSRMTSEPADLENQENRLEVAIRTSEDRISAKRLDFEGQESARRGAWAECERIDRRLSEIDGLKERFELLDQRYNSDLERLEAIAEAGQFFVALSAGTCPLCGAPAGNHSHQELPHDGDIDRLRNACESEITKIELFRRELTQAVHDLDLESLSLQKEIVAQRANFAQAENLLRETLAPSLSAARSEHWELLETRSQVQQARSLLDRIDALRDKRAEAERALSTAGRPSDERPSLPAASVKVFSESVETLLTAWNFPLEKPVYFDDRHQDLVLGSRRRGEQGKGLRALTHAAFTVGLQLAIGKLGRDPVGFALLDSPLVTFREASSDEELQADQKVAVKQAFYSDLADRLQSLQLIVFENEDPDKRVWPLIKLHLFSKSRADGLRYGFFPV